MHSLYTRQKPVSSYIAAVDSPSIQPVFIFTEFQIPLELLNCNNSDLRDVNLHFLLL